MILHLDLLLRSETCFSGSGGGRIGGVDIDLETDPESALPIVRGRTLKGLLLEELALILRTLEPAHQGPWHTTAEHLFGTPGQSGGAKLSFHDGRLPADLRAAIEQNRWGREEVLAALTTVRHQTKVNDQTGAPEPHSLRSSRLLRAGAGPPIAGAARPGLGRSERGERGRRGAGPFASHRGQAIRDGGRAPDRAVSGTRWYGPLRAA